MKLVDDKARTRRNFIGNNDEFAIRQQKSTMWDLGIRLPSEDIGTILIMSVLGHTPEKHLTKHLDCRNCHFC